MPDACDFETIRIQVIVFAPGLDIQTTKVIGILLTDYSERFDGDLQSFPWPKDVPGDLPRAVLESGDGQFKFEVGPGRLSLQWNRKDEEAMQPRNVVDEGVNILRICLERFPVEIGRLALVLSRNCPCENPSTVLINRFCTAESQQEPFNRSANFEIHNHKQYVLPSFTPELLINSWVRCKSATFGASKQPGITVEQDLNTRAEDVEKRRFSIADISTYFKIATFEADNVLEKYFPGQSI
jgi:hypothetical protein